jgi:exopolysaccharide production protein ExoZ
MMPRRNPEADNSSTNGGMTLHSIQCMRFIAAIIVVLFHSYASFAPLASVTPAAGAAYAFGFGKVGVHIFFVISGYIMYLASFGRHDRFRAGQFFLRRLMRIYPIYWIFVLLYLIIFYIFDIMPVMSLSQFAEMLALIPPSAPLVIGPAWTLAYEIYFYLVFGLIMVLGPLRGTVALTATFVGCAVIGMVLRPEHPIAAMATNALLLEFCMGIWIARFTIRYALPRFGGWVAMAGAACLYVAGLTWGYDRGPSAIIWGVPSALLIAGMVILEKTGRARLMRRLSWLGDSSYVLYLCHISIITLVIILMRWLGLALPLPLLLITVTAGCIVFAALFHVAIERPLTMILHRAISPRKL